MPTNTPPLSDDTTVHTLIIDTDPGADDVIALLLAMAVSYTHLTLPTKA
mgnify:CR=1 FL=1